MGKTRNSVHKKIMHDQLGANLLKESSEDTGTERRHGILGANLIKYVSAWSSGA